MSPRAFVPLLCLSFVACQMASAPERAAEARIAELQTCVDALQAEVRLLTVQVARSAAVAPLADVESPALAELNARLTALTAQLAEASLRPTAAGVAPAPGGETAAMATKGATDERIVETLRIAITGAEQQRLAHVTNLAHVPTTAWKKLRVDTGVPGAAASRVTRDFAPGALTLTNRALDVAIDGDGFFAVTLPDGTTGYTRDGSLHVDAEGKLVTATGAILQPEITLPCDVLEVSIDPMGNVTGRTAGSPDTATRFGQLTISRFVNPSGLRENDGLGGNLFRPSDESGSPVTAAPGNTGLGTLKQGFLENSNVVILDELMALQAAERHLAALRRTLAGNGVWVR